jgi:hypothetical protein
MRALFRIEGSVMSVEMTTAAEPQEAFCPRCALPVSWIQVYEAPTFVFGIFFYAWSWDTLLGCRRCVRGGLVKRLFVNVVTANVFWWVMLPWYLILLGHSLAESGPRIPDQYREQLATKPIRTAVADPKALSPMVRAAIVVGVLAVVVVFGLVIMPRLVAQ